MMDEAEAKRWLTAETGVPRETIVNLERFAHLLREENERQNLVSRGSLEHLWVRHIVDSAQLLRWSPAPDAAWLDLGTGAGFPGLIVAALHDGPVTLVEVRKLRVDFLRRAADVLGVGERLTILCAKAEAIEARPYDVISARAFAPLDKLLLLGERFSTAKTRWILPKGRNAHVELEAAESLWQGDFRLEPSLTDADASIIVAQGVRRRGGGKSR
jgi:16S rRNA (guanine527-N7)-methyltransferase